MKVFVKLTFLILALSISIAFAANLTETAAVIAQSFATELATDQPRKVAVVDPIDPTGKITAFGRFVAEEVTNALIKQKPKNLTVIDRLYLDRILQEQKLTLSGLVSDANALQQVGKIAGIDILILGTYFELGNSVRLSLKALDVRTAQVVAAANTTVDLDTATANLLKVQLAQPTPRAASGTNTQTGTNVAGDIGFSFAQKYPNVSWNPNEQSIYVACNCDLDKKENKRMFRFTVKPQQGFIRIDFILKVATNKIGGWLEIVVNGQTWFADSRYYVYADDSPRKLSIPVGYQQADSEVEVRFTYESGQPCSGVLVFQEFKISN